MKIVVYAKAILLMVVLLVFNSCSDDDSSTAPPSINDFSPTEGIAGTTVTINGTNFSAVTSENIVKFNGTTANVTVASTTTLTVMVPIGATSGKIAIEVNSQTTTSSGDFKVLAMPAITGFTPMEGIAGTTVTITGINFSTVISENIVMFNGEVASITGATATTLTVTVPAGTTGKITVQVGTQKTASLDDFIYKPLVTVSTLAGSGTTGFADGTGTAAQFDRPYGVALDANGNVYVADGVNQRIRKITTGGAVSTLAGSGTAGFADGIGATAQFRNPTGIAVDASGNVYVGDVTNNRIRKITPNGVVSTLAGDGTSGLADGTGTAAKFSSPSGLTVDAAGNVYVCDRENNCIRKITPDGVVSTLAGDGAAGAFGYADGVGTAARFTLPRSITVDPAGNLYVVDYGNHRIRKVTSGGVVTTLAGSSKGFADGMGIAAKFDYPLGIARDTEGNLYVADYNNQRIRKITPSGEVSTLAGSGTQGFVDGTGATAQFEGPFGIGIDVSGNLYVSDRLGHRIRKITIQ
jgi:sugar lactone lactonase YvrE